MRRACQVVIIASLLLGFVAHAHSAEDGSGRSAQPGATRAGLQSIQDIPDSFELIAENATFQLFADKTTLAFKVVDKRSGYVWHSNLDERAEGDKLNKTWTAFAQSGISIDYLDEKAADRRASVTNAEHSLDLTLVDQGFEATVKFAVPSITLTVAVRLEDNGVSVEVPFDSIKEEDPKFKLGMLHLYPFLGATRTDTVPGYMFIPDGAGTLIQFAAETKAQNMFYGRFYGDDLGMIGEMPWDPQVRRAFKLSIPVIGMVHGEKQNAFISIVEDGAAYAELQAHPAGVTTNFNFLYAAFVYNESYFQPTNRAGAGVTVIQHDTNAFDVKIHHRFLTGKDGDYVGMARSYQQYLVDKGALNRVSDPDADIGIRLEFLGGEKEKILFWYRAIPMTTVKQMADILDHLEVKNPEVIYYGWQPGGASSMPPQSLKLDRSLGTVSQLKSVAEKITAAGGRLSLYLDPQAAIWHEKGYSARRDLAMSIANANLMGFNRYKVNYYFNLQATSRRYAALRRDISSTLGAGLAVDTLGSMLYSDFKSGSLLNRENAIKEYQRLLQESGGSTSFYTPNDYVFGLMDAYYDIPLTDSGYIYTTQTVPFLQIVLAGYVPYYGPALNFSSNVRDDLLRMADFGVYPSYYLTQEPTARILTTGSEWIYTSSYEQWGKDIEAAYAWLNNLLKPVKGQAIVSRQVLGEGVVSTAYANGKQIIVNYSDTPYSAGNVVVNGKDAVLVEVNP